MKIYNIYKVIKGLVIYATNFINRQKIKYRILKYNRNIYDMGINKLNYEFFKHIQSIYQQLSYISDICLGFNFSDYNKNPKKIKNYLLFKYLDSILVKETLTYISTINNDKFINKFIQQNSHAFNKVLDLHIEKLYEFIYKYNSQNIITHTSFLVELLHFQKFKFQDLFENVIEIKIDLDSLRDPNKYISFVPIIGEDSIFRTLKGLSYHLNKYNISKINESAISNLSSFINLQAIQIKQKLSFNNISKYEKIKQSLKYYDPKLSIRTIINNIIKLKESDVINNIIKISSYNLNYTPDNISNKSRTIKKDFILEKYIDYICNKTRRKYQNKFNIYNSNRIKQLMNKFLEVDNLDNSEYQISFYNRNIYRELLKSLNESGQDIEMEFLDMVNIVIIFYNKYYNKEIKPVLNILLLKGHFDSREYQKQVLNYFYHIEYTYKTILQTESNFTKQKNYLYKLYKFAITSQNTEEYNENIINKFIKKAESELIGHINEIMNMILKFKVLLDKVENQYKNKSVHIDNPIDKNDKRIVISNLLDINDNISNKNITFKNSLHNANEKISVFIKLCKETESFKSFFISNYKNK